MKTNGDSEYLGGWAVIVAVFLLLAFASGCAQAPRGYANQGIPADGGRNLHSVGYYTGADPAFPHSGKGGGGP